MIQRFHAMVVQVLVFFIFILIALKLEFTNSSLITSPSYILQHQPQLRRPRWKKLLKRSKNLKWKVCDFFLLLIYNQEQPELVLLSSSQFFLFLQKSYWTMTKFLYPPTQQRCIYNLQDVLRHQDALIKDKKNAFDRVLVRVEGAICDSKVKEIYRTNLFVTSKNEATNSPNHEYKVMHKGLRAF